MVGRISVYSQTTIFIAFNKTTHYLQYTGILYPRVDMLVLGGEPIVSNNKSKKYNLFFIKFLFL